MSSSLPLLPNVNTSSGSINWSSICRNRESSVIPVKLSDVRAKSCGGRRAAVGAAAKSITPVTARLWGCQRIDEWQLSQVHAASLAGQYAEEGRGKDIR